MHFNVPQFIDTEDKVVGPLTAKQFGWLVVAGVILLILWNTLTFPFFLIFGSMTAGIFGALAFWRPHGQPLIKFVVGIFLFFIRPKMYIWRRIADSLEKKPLQIKTRPEETSRKKNVSEEKIKEISSLLDKAKLK